VKRALAFLLVLGCAARADERVVWCARCPPHETLATAGGGTVAVVEDAALLAAQPPPELLFWSRAEYRQAVSELPAPAIAEVVAARRLGARQRIDDWANALGAEARACVAPAAAVSTEEAARAVRDLERFVGYHRWEQLPAAELLDRAVVAETRLQSERAAAAAALTSVAPPLARRYAVEATEDQRRAVELARARR
jgi:hypothetical protein